MTNEKGGVGDGPAFSMPIRRGTGDYHIIRPFLYFLSLDYKR